MGPPIFSTPNASNNKLTTSSFALKTRQYNMGMIAQTTRGTKVSIGEKKRISIGPQSQDNSFKADFAGKEIF